MTNPPKQDSQASIAGEPALVQNNKNYPSIGHRGHGNNSQSGTYGSLVVSAEIIFMVANNGVTGHEIHSWSPSSIGNEWLILD